MSRHNTPFWIKSRLLRTSEVDARIFAPVAISGFVRYPSLVSDALYFRRSISLGAGGIALPPDYVVYRVERSPGAHQDPVPVVGAFPPHWRPLDSSPGVVNFDRTAAEPLVVRCWLERSAFRHYQRIDERDALALYPELSSVSAGTSGEPGDGRPS